MTNRLRQVFRTRKPLWPMAVCVLASAIILGVGADMSRDLRASAEARARESADNLLHVIERDVARNVEMLGLSLQAVVERVARPDVLAMTPELRRMVLFDRSATASSLGLMAVYDATGTLVIDSVEGDQRQTWPVIDREYFKALRDRDVGLFISRPYMSRHLGLPVLGLSRRINNPDGSFGGVVNATIQLRYFIDLLSKLSLDSDAYVSLSRMDGAVIVRRQSEAREAPTDLSGSPVFQSMVASGGTGRFVAPSAIDGVERLFTYTRVGDLPLILSVALPTRAIYADWSRKTTVAGVILMAVCLVITGLTALLTRELARRARAEIHLVGLNAELARLSRTDPLTGLANRRSFDDDLARELRRASRTGRDLCLIIMDVDYFKPFNDHYGHQAGDATLTTIAGIAAAAASSAGGTAYRVGGEEFGLILPDRRSAIGFLLAETIRGAIRARAIPHDGSPLKEVTASFGAVEVRDETPAEAFARCDGALYRAKSLGRDRTCLGSHAERGDRDAVDRQTG